MLARGYYKINISKLMNNIDKIRKDLNKDYRNKFLYRDIQRMGVRLISIPENKLKLFITYLVIGRSDFDFKLLMKKPKLEELGIPARHFSQVDWELLSNDELVRLFQWIHYAYTVEGKIYKNPTQIIFETVEEIRNGR